MFPSPYIINAQPPNHTVRISLSMSRTQISHHMDLIRSAFTLATMSEMARAGQIFFEVEVADCTTLTILFGALVYL